MNRVKGKVHIEKSVQLLTYKHCYVAAGVAVQTAVHEFWRVNRLDDYIFLSAIFFKNRQSAMVMHTALSICKQKHMWATTHKFFLTSF